MFVPQLQPASPVDVGDEPSLLSLVHRALALPAQVLDKVGQRLPLGGVHVQVLLERDVLLVHVVGVDALGAELATQQLQVTLLELPETCTRGRDQRRRKTTRRTEAIGLNGPVTLVP